MKNFTFRYQEKPLKKAFSGMRKAISTKSSDDINDDEMVCDSLESMLSILSKSRFETFAAIVEYKPESMYDLARKLGKDQAQVLRDTKVLEALGLILLKSMQDGGREKLKPKALYDRITFEFHPRKIAKVS